MCFILSEARGDDRRKGVEKQSKKREGGEKNWRREKLWQIGWGVDLNWGSHFRLIQILMRFSIVLFGRGGSAR